jgi:hypothetical protein
VEDNFAVVLPNGDTFSEGNAPPEMVQPPVGTRLFISEVVYDTADGTTRGAEVGRTHIECTTQVVQPTFMCDAALAFSDGSQLNGTVASPSARRVRTSPSKSP